MLHTLALSAAFPILTFVALARIQYLIEGREKVDHWFFGVRLSITTLSFTLVHLVDVLDNPHSTPSPPSFHLEYALFTFGVFVVIVDQIVRHKKYYDISNPSFGKKVELSVFCNVLGLCFLGTSIYLIAR